MPIAAILLAAGAAERFGGQSKLLADLGGVPLIVHAARAIVGSNSSGFLAVTGRDGAAVAAALQGSGLQIIPNPNWAEGLGGSVAAGVRALQVDACGVLIVPGDMPFLTPGYLNALIDRFTQSPEPRPILFPQLPDGTQGNPVLWPRRFFAELAELSGAKGGKALLNQHAQVAQAFPVTDARLFVDIDTPDDLVRAAALLPASA